jgi:hypothetical protein
MRSASRNRTGQRESGLTISAPYESVPPMPVPVPTPGLPTPGLAGNQAGVIVGGGGGGGGGQQQQQQQHHRVQSQVVFQQVQAQVAQQEGRNEFRTGLHRSEMI